MTAAVSTHERHRLALVVIATAQLMVMLDMTIVNVALPTIQNDLHFSTTNLTWVIDAYVLVFGGLLLLGGRTGDIFGRRRMFSIGIALFARAKSTLRPGGHLYVIGHHLDALGLSGPPDPARLYTEEILRDAFDDLAIERLERLERRLEDGGSQSVVDVLLWATAAPAVSR